MMKEFDYQIENRDSGIGKGHAACFDVTYTKKRNEKISFCISQFSWTWNNWEYLKIPFLVAQKKCNWIFLQKISSIHFSMKKFHVPQTGRKKCCWEDVKTNISRTFFIFTQALIRSWRVLDGGSRALRRNAYKCSFQNIFMMVYS